MDRATGKLVTVRCAAAGYLGVGLAISLYQNLVGELTAFAWTGSWTGNLLLLFWWLIVPALFWPWDVFWALFHRLL